MFYPVYIVIYLKIHLYQYTTSDSPTFEFLPVLHLNIMFYLNIHLYIRMNWACICISRWTCPFTYLMICVFPVPTPDIWAALSYRSGNWARNVRPTLPTCSRQMPGDTGLTNWLPVQVLCCTLTRQYYQNTVLSTPETVRYSHLLNSAL